MDWGAIGTMGTMFAVLLVAVQLMDARKHAQAEFEDSLDKQFRDITISLPVRICLGEPCSEAEKVEIENIIYNYLDLCNEQAMWRNKGRISKSTWNSWAKGMEQFISYTEFSDTYDKCKSKINWSYLDFIVETEFKTDPVKFK